MTVWNEIISRFRRAANDAESGADMGSVWGTGISGEQGEKSAELILSTETK